MRYQSNERLHELGEQHGPHVYHRGWLYFADGHCAEWNEMYGVREVGERTAEQRREVQQFYWQTTLDGLQREFLTLKERCTTLAESATLTVHDKQELKELREQVRHAAKMLEQASTPAGPSDKDIRAAKKLYYERAELGEQVKRAEASYHEAIAKTNGRQTNRSNKLGQAWEAAWNDWDEANRAYQSLPDDVQRAANVECWNEEREQAANEQLQDLETIEI